MQRLWMVLDRLKLGLRYRYNYTFVEARSHRIRECCAAPECLPSELEVREPEKAAVESFEAHENPAELVREGK